MFRFYFDVCSVILQGGEKNCFLSFVPHVNQTSGPSSRPLWKKKSNKIKNILFKLSYFSIILHFLSATTTEKKKPLSINPREGKKKKKKSFYPFQKSNKNLNADIYFVKKVLFNLFVFRQDFLSWEGGGGGGNLGSHDHILNFSYATITHRQFPSNR